MDMVIAYHAIWSAYGFWLPNEERGSWSTEVWAPQLRRFGDATKTDERRSVAHRGFDKDLRREMRAALQYPPVRFNCAQIDCVGRGINDAIDKFNIVLHACAVLWDHVHIISHRHKEDIEFIARVIKSAATRQLTREGMHPLARYVDNSGRTPTPWAKGGWERYLNQPMEIRDTSDYVNNNPEKHALPRQLWPFVKPLAV